MGRYPTKRATRPKAVATPFAAAVAVTVNCSERLSHVGSVIAGQSNERYSEPALGGNRIFGLSAQYQFQAGP
jgi:hypothetical protein